MFGKSASLFSGFLKPEDPPTNAAFTNAAEGGLLREKVTHPQPAETYHGRKPLRQKIKSPFLAEFYHKRGPACWAKSNG